MKIRKNKSVPAFSLAEMLVVMLILTIVMASVAHTGFKFRKVEQQKPSHGYFTCYWNSAGTKLTQKLFSEDGTLTEERDRTDVGYCEFNPVSDSMFFSVDAIGGGAGGNIITASSTDPDPADLMSLQTTRTDYSYLYDYTKPESKFDASKSQDLESTISSIVNDMESNSYNPIYMHIFMNSDPGDYVGYTSMVQGTKPDGKTTFDDTEDRDVSHSGTSSLGYNEWGREGMMQTLHNRNGTSDYEVGYPYKNSASGNMLYVPVEFTKDYSLRFYIGNYDGTRCGGVVPNSYSVQAGVSNDVANTDILFLNHGQHGFYGGGTFNWSSGCLIGSKDYNSNTCYNDSLCKAYLTTSYNIIDKSKIKVRNGASSVELEYNGPTAHPVTGDCYITGENVNTGRYHCNHDEMSFFTKYKNLTYGFPWNKQYYTLFGNFIRIWKEHKNGVNVYAASGGAGSSLSYFVPTFSGIVYIKPGKGGNADYSGEDTTISYNNDTESYRKYNDPSDTDGQGIHLKDAFITVKGGRKSSESYLPGLVFDIKDKYVAFKGNLGSGYNDKTLNDENYKNFNQPKYSNYNYTGIDDPEIPITTIGMGGRGAYTVWRDISRNPSQYKISYLAESLSSIVTETLSDFGSSSTMTGQIRCYSYNSAGVIEETADSTSGNVCGPQSGGNGGVFISW